MAKKGTKKSISLTLRNYFITGVVVLIPIGFTLYLTKILIGVSSNLIPKNINSLGVNVFYEMKKGLQNIDIIIMLRLQLERMSGSFVPSIREYFRYYGLDRDIDARNHGATYQPSSYTGSNQYRGSNSKKGMNCNCEFFNKDLE